MNRNDKYTRYSRTMLLALVVMSIALFVFVPKFNFSITGVSKEKSMSQPSIEKQLEELGVKAELIEVLGATETGGGGGCTDGGSCSSNVSLAEVPQCSVNNASGTMIGGKVSGSITVNLDAKVEPFVVTTPQPLLQGSKYVDDSRKIISYDYPVYRDSQNIVLADEARRICAPGVDCAMYDEIAGRKDFPFKINSFIEVRDADEGGDNGKGKTVIYSVPSLRSSCPDIQNAKANPRRSAGFAGELDVRRQPPVDPEDKENKANNNGIHSVSRSFGGVKCLRKPPDGETLSEAKTFTMCIADVKPTDFMVAAFYELEHWLNCLKGEDSCEETRLFAIRMDPLYGGQMKCAKPDCEIRYFEYEYLKNVAPGDAASQIPEDIDLNQVSVFQPVTDAYYIGTPCKIRINKWGVHNIPCIWDISPYKKQFQIQKAAFMPKDPTMPQTFEEYWSGGVMPELRKRSISCI